MADSGQTEAALQEYIGAAAYFTAAKDPGKLSHVYVAIGECEWKLDRPSEAFRAFNEAAELDPNNAAAQLQLAKLFMSGGAPERAMVAAEIVLSQDPNNLDAMTAAAVAAADEGRRREAVERLERVLSRDAKRVDAAVLLASVYSELGRPDQARDTLRTATRNAPGDPAALLALGRLEEEQGQMDAAETAYRQAVSTQDGPQTDLRLAQFLTRTARPQEAQELLEKVDKLRPSEPWTLGDFQLRLGNPELASQRYVKALSGPQGNLARSRTLARAIESLLAVAEESQDMQRERALTQARTLLTSNIGTLPSLEAQLLQAEISLADGNTEEGLRLAQAAVQSAPDSAPAHYVLGTALRKSDKPLLARQEWQKALDQEEDFVPARIAAAQDALMAGDLKTAEHMVAGVVRHEPENMAALHLFSRVLLARSDFGSAQSIAERALALQKNSPAPYVLLGDIALSANRSQVAVLYYEQALLLTADYAPAMDGLVRAYRRGTISRDMLLRVERIGSSRPPSATLLELAGRLFAQHGWTADAQRCFRESLQAEPGRKSVTLQLSALTRQTGDRGQALQLAANTSQTGRALIDALAAEHDGNPDAAIPQYETAVRRGEKSGTAANNLAWLYATKGANLDRALQLAIRARDAQPQNAAVNDTLGYVLLKRREYSRAVAVLEHAGELLRFEKDPDTSVQSAVRQHLAEAYRCSGETQKADMLASDLGAQELLGSE